MKSPMNPQFKTALYYLVGAAFLAVLAVAVFESPNLGGDPNDAPQTAHKHDDAAATLYTCPMHPQIIRDEAGQCPICGMDLVPAGDGDAVPMGASNDAIAIDPVVVQNMALRTAAARRGEYIRSVRSFGEVDVAESEVAVVNLRYSGWAERVYVDETGVAVKRGQPLMAVYSPELGAAQEEYLSAVRADGVDGALARSARERLASLGMASSLIDKLPGNGEAYRLITVYAPAAGYVLHKNVVEGARVMAGTDAYRIGDLTSIWVRAQVYEQDAPSVHVGMPARMSLSGNPDEKFDGEVAFVDPGVDRKTRTLGVRLEFANPGLDLRPGMTANVELQVESRADALMIPTDAVIRGGKRSLVFVDVGRGRFEPREVVVGPRGDEGNVPVTSGVKEGEMVVVSGQFLLDSESSLREAARKFLDAGRKQSESAGNAASDTHATHDHVDDTYWTCSMHPQIIRDEPGTCPICGMDLVERKR
ncbi:MAG: efflux RND transporter periplasmic adaptor subunit [Deltaproteobacteria bacterium]|nr:efflux RND transporter periplasmic adaptor subunit [Deltaproteobacteria bacterium]